jgi:hypothetical protein
MPATYCNSGSKRYPLHLRWKDKNIECYTTPQTKLGTVPVTRQFLHPFNYEYRKFSSLPTSPVSEIPALFFELHPNNLTTWNILTLYSHTCSLPVNNIIQRNPSGKHDSGPGGIPCPRRCGCTPISPRKSTLDCCPSDHPADYWNAKNWTRVLKPRCWLFSASHKFHYSFLSGFARYVFKGDFPYVPAYPICKSSMLIVTS